MTVIHSCPSCDWQYTARGHADKVADLKFEEHWRKEHKRKVKREANTDAPAPSRRKS